MYRTAARQTALPTLIGPLIGVPTIDVAASATAEALPANAVACVKPFMIPDKWTENSDGQGRATGTWTPASQFDVLGAFGAPLARPDVYMPGPRRALHRLHRLARQGPRADASCGHRPAGDIHRLFCHGRCRPIVPITVTTLLVATRGRCAWASGRRGTRLVGALTAGVQDLIDQDPQARWDSRCKCVVDSAYGPTARGCFLFRCMTRPRTRRAAGTGGRGYRVANFLGFFVDSLQGDSVTGYITDIIGVTDATAGPAPAAASPRRSGWCSRTWRD